MLAGLPVRSHRVLGLPLIFLIFLSHLHISQLAFSCSHRRFDQVRFYSNLFLFASSISHLFLELNQNTFNMTHTRSNEISTPRTVSYQNTLGLFNAIGFNHFPMEFLLFFSVVMTESTFKARDIGLRAQKKILSRMAGKNIAKVFIDDVTASLLDNLYRLAKQYSNNKKEAEKLIKNIIKIVIKLGVLHKNNLLSEDDLKLAERFKNKFRMAGMTIISFYEVDFSYDRNYLVQALGESQKILQAIISRHLTDKSFSRVESVFSFFSNETFLDSIFRRDSEYRTALGRVVADLNKAIENGDL